MGLEIVWRRKMRICEQILDRGGRALVGMVIALSASGCIAIYGTAEFPAIPNLSRIGDWMDEMLFIQIGC